MRLLLITGAYPPMASGEAANSHALATHLAAAGVTVDVLTRVGAGQSPPGVAVYPVMTGWRWRGLPRIVKYLREVRPDAVLILYLGAAFDHHPMVTLLPTIIRRLLPNTRIVSRFEYPLSATKYRRKLGHRVADRLTWMALRQPGGNRIYGNLVAGSDQVVYLCEQHRQVLAEWHPGISIRGVLIPPPPNVPVIPDPTGELAASGRHELGAAPGDFLVGYFGYIYRTKGVETLLKAIRSLRASGVPVRLVAIGGAIDLAPMETDYATVRDQARDLEEEGGAIWTGAFHAVDHRVARLIHAVDLFVLPFDSGAALNNSSLSTLASYGKAIVTTTGDLTDPVLAASSDFRLVPPRDATALAEAILSLRDATARAALAKGALTFADRWFSWKTATKQTIAALHGHLGTPSDV